MEVKFTNMHRSGSPKHLAARLVSHRLILTTSLPPVDGRSLLASHVFKQRMWPLYRLIDLLDLAIQGISGCVGHWECSG